MGYWINSNVDAEMRKGYETLYDICIQNTGVRADMRVEEGAVHEVELGMGLV